MEVRTLAFELVVAAAKDRGLLKGKTVGVDATDLRRSASVTLRRPWHSTWVELCARWSALASQDTWQYLPKGFVLTISSCNCVVTSHNDP